MKRLILSAVVVFALALALVPSFAAESAGDKNKAHIKQFYEETFNKGKMDSIEKYVTADAVDHEEVPGKKGPGTCRENIKEFLGTFKKAFPDLKVKVEDVIAEGDKVVARCTLMGTHKGEFMGMAATGKTFSVEFIDILRFKDGKIVEHWGVSDDAGLMEQLGGSAGK